MDGLPPEIVGAAGGAGGLATVYLVVRIVSAAVKTVNERRVDDRRIVLADAETRRAMQEATEAGVGTLGELVLSLRSEVNQLRGDIVALGSKYTTFRSLVLKFIGEITAILPDMPSDIRQRVQNAIERFKGDADAT